MQFVTLDNWVDPDRFAGMLFMVQRLDEMTFQYTLDSYKAPTTNAPLLVQECLAQIEDCLNAGVPLPSAFRILDELEKQLSKNSLARDLTNLPIHSYIEKDRSNISELTSKLRILSREINPYVYALRAMDELSKLAETNEKKKINFLCRELVTSIIGIGVSPFHINRTIKETFYSKNEITDSSVLDPFFQDIFPHFHNFRVCLKIRSVIQEIDEDTQRKFHLNICSDISDEFELNNLPKGFSELTDRQKFVLVNDIHATDSFGAVELARERVMNLHDLFRVYHHKGQCQIDRVGITEQACCAKELISSPTHINRMQFISDNRASDASSKLADLLGDLNLHRGDDKNKFFRAVDFHGMSLDSNVIENQILNIWTAFETIVPFKSGKSNVGNVVDAVSPFTGLNYSQRLFQRIVYDIKRWNRSVLDDILSGIDWDSDCDSVDKVFCLICANENEEAFSKLLEKAQSFELLKFRLTQLRNSFCTPASAKKTIASHQERVSWQIYRIYRTRNSIVHSGITPKFAGLLIDNAHDYFDQVFERCCELGSGDNAFDNFTECFDFVRLQYSEYVDSFNSVATWNPSGKNMSIWQPKSWTTKQRFFSDT